MKVLSKIKKAKSVQEIREAVDRHLLDSPLQDVEYHVNNILDHLKNANYSIHYLHSLGLDQNQLISLHNLLDQAYKMTHQIVNNLERVRELDVNNDSSMLNDEELKEIVIKRLHESLG